MHEPLTSSTLQKGAQEPDSKLITRFWRHFGESYKSRTVDKNDADEMAIVAAFLDRFGVVQRDDFMRHFTTTIGKNIYTPFTVGEPDPDWTPFGQMVVCVHEHQHIGQAMSLGFAKFATEYLAKTSRRTAFECDAYACDLQMLHWRYGVIPSGAIDRILHSLDNYALTDTDKTVARRLLHIRAKVIERRGVVNDAARRALVWLNRYAPHLKK
jgi:hypothetical protein